MLTVSLSPSQAKLSRLCEQDKAVQALEQKLQQLHKEKVRAPPGGDPHLCLSC